ncbi:hypothetical protein AB1N83_010910 [Pleurotus pulmonarius]
MKERESLSTRHLVNLAKLSVKHVHCSDDADADTRSDEPMLGLWDGLSLRGDGGETRHLGGWVRRQRLEWTLVSVTVRVHVEQSSVHVNPSRRRCRHA